jgi:hypothetical protein
MTAKDTREARNAKGARDGLAEYRRRRDFSKTAEPRGGRKKARRARYAGHLPRPVGAQRPYAQAAREGRRELSGP